MSEWEGARHAWEDRIRGLENQKKALLEKSDMTQVNLVTGSIVSKGGIVLMFSPLTAMVLGLFHRLCTLMR